MPEKEYIEREAAYDYNTLECWYQDSLLNPNSPPVWTNEHLEELLNDFYLIPKDTPIADVAKVKHGVWLTQEYQDGKDDEGDEWVEKTAEQGDYAYCSLCLNDALLNGGEAYVLSDYCPHCGAKMDLTNP
jgi:hypothetical protein